MRNIVRVMAVVAVLVAVLGQTAVFAAPVRGSANANENARISTLDQVMGFFGAIWRGLSGQRISDPGSSTGEGAIWNPQCRLLGVC